MRPHFLHNDANYVVNFLNTTTYVSFLSVDCAWFVSRLYHTFIARTNPKTLRRLARALSESALQSNSFKKKPRLYMDGWWDGLNRLWRDGVTILPRPAKKIATAKNNRPVPAPEKKKKTPRRPVPSKKKKNHPVPPRKKKTTAPSRLGKKQQPPRPASKKKQTRPVPP